MSAFNLTFHHRDLSCSLVRTNRKTISLTCTPEGTVQVRGPMRTSVDDAKKVIDANMTWIRHKLAVTEAARENVLCDEMTIHLLGKPFAILEGDRHDFGEEWIMIPKNAENRKKAIDKSCRMLAEKVFRERVDRLAPMVGVTPGEIRIGWGITQKWGSCSRSGDLYFTWKALFCEPHDLDYLVIHELCHLLCFNHSQRFWNCVSHFVPDYRACRERMEKVHNAVRAQGWINY